MRNKLLVSLLSLLTVIAFSNLANAQDPEGTPDDLFVNCLSAVFPGSGTTAVTLELRFNSDNTGINRIAGFGPSLIISGSNLVSIDTTVAGAFTGTVVSGFGVLTVGKNTNPDPTVFPAEMSYGAVSFSGGVTGLNQLLANINVVVNDTGIICIDSFPTPTTPWNNAFVTEGAVGYAPVWTAPPGFCCPVVPYQNQAPVVSCGPDREAFAGGTFNHLVLATDPDDPNDICDNIVSAEFQFLDSTLAPVGPVNTAPCGTATLSAFAPGPAVGPTFDWNTTGCGGGDYYVVFTFTDECGGSGADTCKYTIKTACAFVTIGEVVGDPCQTVELPVYLNAAGDDIGGFNFCIEFANADLTVISVRRGELIDEVDPQYNNKYKWHYFTYRLNPSTIIHKYKVCVVGLGNVYSSYPGMCIAQGSEGVLFYIKFVLACNELFRCHDTHVSFEWDDWTCLENTLSDCTGNLLYVSDNPLLYDPEVCGLGEKNEVVRCVNFGDGRVIWRCPQDVDPIVIGDINVNGFAYEIADATLFARYFVEGLSVFSPDYDTRQAQVGATDINLDGYTLSVADFVYLLRILVGDQAPLGGALSADATVKIDYNGRLVHMTTPQALGAIVFTFSGEGTIVPMAEGVNTQFNAANGETKVIVYTTSKEKQVESGDLFAVRGKLEMTNVEAATWKDAQSINVEFVSAIPKAFGLSQNYPNPFNATTQISFAMPSNGNVSLKVYNVAGQLVKSFNQRMDAGYKTITWDGTNSRGDAVASGVYFYRLDAKLDSGENHSKTLKMTLLK